jgi:hypothetical protein
MPIGHLSSATLAERIERQIAVAVVIAVEEPTLLLATHRIVGSVEIEDDLARRAIMRGTIMVISPYGWKRGGACCQMQTIQKQYSRTCGRLEVRPIPIGSFPSSSRSWGPGRLSESNLGHRGRASRKGRSVYHL